MSTFLPGAAFTVSGLTGIGDTTDGILTISGVNATGSAVTNEVSIHSNIFTGIDLTAGSQIQTTYYQIFSTPVNIIELLKVRFPTMTNVSVECNRKDAGWRARVNVLDGYWLVLADSTGIDIKSEFFPDLQEEHYLDPLDEMFEPREA